MSGSRLQLLESPRRAATPPSDPVLAWLASDPTVVDHIISALRLAKNAERYVPQQERDVAGAVVAAIIEARQASR